MRFSLREVDPDRKFLPQLKLELLTQVFPREQVRALLAATGAVTPRGVIQELYGLLLAHYAVRFLMHEAALQAATDPDRLSFTHALRVIQDSLPDFEIAAPELLPGLYRRLLRELADPLLPEREPRQEPRVVRRKISKWPLKRLEHQHWPQPTRPAWKSLALCDWGGGYPALI